MADIVAFLRCCNFFGSMKNEYSIETPHESMVICRFGRRAEGVSIFITHTVNIFITYYTVGFLRDTTLSAFSRDTVSIFKRHYTVSVLIRGSMVSVLPTKLSMMYGCSSVLLMYSIRLHETQTHHHRSKLHKRVSGSEFTGQSARCQMCDRFSRRCT